MSGAPRRIRRLVIKESQQILRDPSSIMIAFVMPVILLLLFGYGVSLDARNVRLTIVIEAPSREASSFAGSFLHSPYFAATIVRDRQSAEHALADGRAQGVLVLRADFARRLHNPRGAPIQLLLDGTDANTARIVSGYVEGAWRNWYGALAAAEGRPVRVPVLAEPRVWFNPGVRSQDFLVPGLIAINMTLIGALLTALVIAREWERGTMEVLIVTPVRAYEIVLGKLVPYFLLGLGGMGLSTAMAVWLFAVPLRGSFLALLGISALFMLAALGIGLLISSVAGSQFVAGQIAILAAFLPAFILSGFLFDTASMPEVVQWITRVIPARYFVSSLQTLFLAGDIRAVLLSDAAALALMAAALLAATLRLSRKRLD